MQFMIDALSSGRRFRLLVVLDDYTRECPDVFSRVIGRLVAVVPPARNQWNRGPEAEKMRRSFNEEGYKADIATLRQIHSGLQTFEQHPRRNGWKNAPPVPTALL